MAPDSKVVRLARGFAAEWLRPSDPDHATEAMVDTLSTAMLAFHAVARGVEQRACADALAPSKTADELREEAHDLFSDAAGWRDAADHGAPFDPRILTNEARAADLNVRADTLEAPRTESGEEQDLSGILQSVLLMIGLPGFNAAWFDERGDWDFGKLRDHGLDARLAEISAALRAAALDAQATAPRQEHP